MNCNPKPRTVTLLFRKANRKKEKLRVGNEDKHHDAAVVVEQVKRIFCMISCTFSRRRPHVFSDPSCRTSSCSAISHSRKRINKEKLQTPRKPRDPGKHQLKEDAGDLFDGGSRLAGRATGTLGGTSAETVGEAAGDELEVTHAAGTGGLSALGLLGPVVCDSQVTSQSIIPLQICCCPQHHDSLIADSSLKPPLIPSSFRDVVGDWRVG